MASPFPKLSWRTHSSTLPVCNGKARCSESSRLSFMISGAGQTFNDMELFRQRVYPH